MAKKNPMEPNPDEPGDSESVEQHSRGEESAPDSLADALRDQLASERHWLEAFAGMAGKLRLLAVLILLLVLAGLALVWLLQGIVTGLDPGGTP
jgi:hypothetical protein